MSRHDFYTPVVYGPWIELANPAPATAMEPTHATEDHRMTTDYQLANDDLSDDEIDAIAARVLGDDYQPPTTPTSAAAARVAEILADPNISPFGSRTERAAGYNPTAARARAETAANGQPFGPGFDEHGRPTMETNAQRELREAAERAHQQLEAEAAAKQHQFDTMTTREKAGVLAARARNAVDTW